MFLQFYLTQTYTSLALFIELGWHLFVLNMSENGGNEVKIRWSTFVKYVFLVIEVAFGMVYQAKLAKQAKLNLSHTLYNKPQLPKE